jgi:hypothetical protein
MKHASESASSTPELLSEREIEALYGLRVAWLRRRRREGGGPPFLKILKMVRYTRADVNAFLSAHRLETSHSEPMQAGAALDD